MADKIYYIKQHHFNDTVEVKEAEVIKETPKTYILGRNEMYTKVLRKDTLYTKSGMSTVERFGTDLSVLYDVTSGALSNHIERMKESIIRLEKLQVELEKAFKDFGYDV